MQVSTTQTNKADTKLAQKETQIKQSAVKLSDNKDTETHQPASAKKNSEPKVTIASEHQTQTFNPEKFNKQVSAKGLAESKAENQSGQTNFTISNDKIHTGDSAIIHFNTNEAKAGDVYKIVIPEVGDGLDASGTYDVKPGDFQGDYGNTAVKYDKDKKEWVVTDTFTKANTNNQPINLATSDNFDEKKLHSTGDFNRSAFLYKNDQLIRIINFTQNVSTNSYLYWNGPKYNDDDSIYTMDGNKVIVKDQGPELVANTDYKWNLQASIDPNFNHGTEITIPMADHFKLDLTKTNELNEDLLEQYRLSFTQTGNDVKITLPKLTDAELTKLNQDNHYKTDFSLTVCGKFDMDVPNGKTPLANTTEPTLTEKTNDQNDQNTNKIGSVPVVILGKDNALDREPVGNIIHGNVGPDTYEYKANGDLDYEKPVTSMDDVTKHNLNNQIDIDNVSPYELKNVVATIDVPDGMNISALSVNDKKKNFDYTYTFTDGTTETGSYQGEDSSIPAKSNKSIKSIQLKFKELKAYEGIDDFGLNGVLAKKYSNGTDVKVGNMLTTNLSLTYDHASENPAIFSRSQKIVAKTPVRPEIHNFNDRLYGEQNSDYITKVGQKNAGNIYVTNVDMPQKSEKLTYYIVLPTNAEVNAEDGLQDLSQDAKVDELEINGRKVLKITGTYERKNSYPNHWSLNLDNSDIINDKNQQSELKAYVVLPDGEDYSDKVTDSDSLPFVENSHNAYYLGQISWTVIAATGTYAKSKAKGNKNISLVSEGRSDDKGLDEMTFGNVISNSTDAALDNATIISRVPTMKDGKSEFNFSLKDGNPISVIDIANGDRKITNGITNYYSIDDLDFSKISKDTPNLMSHFKTADQITDWSKVTAVLTNIATVAGNSAYSVNLNGYDPNFIKDVNKTAYASNVIWATNLNRLEVKAGSKESASVKITGQSIVNFKLHFEDNSRPDISIPKLSHTYQDNTDIMQKDDFIKATKNSDFDDTVNAIKDERYDEYNLIAKAVMDQIPDGYVLDVENPRIENADVDYPENRVNNSAKFGQKVMYDFDGDTVVYNLVKKQNFEQNIVIKRNIQFVDKNNPSHKLRTDKSDSAPTIQISGQYNPLTDKIYTNSINYNNLLDNNKLKDFTVPDLNTFRYIDNNLEIYLSENKLSYAGSGFEGLIENVLKKNKYTGKSGLCYKMVKDNSGTELKQDSTAKVADNTIEFDQDIVLYYLLSHANLILINPTGNKLLDSSDSVDQNYHENPNIVFNKSDQDLKRAGYTYKIYYFGDQSLSNLASQNLRQIGENSPDFNAIINAIDRSYLENYLVPDNLGTGYTSLADALKAKGQYDEIVDQNNSENGGKADYTQNFFVVYTPEEQRKQNFYILSDNDPYANNNVTKPYAIPKTTQEADESGTDYFKIQGDSAESLIKPSYSGTSQYNAFRNSGSDTTWQNGQYDSNGNLAHHTPSLPENDSTLGMLKVYDRSGYYIDKATYQVTDKQGKQHKVVISTHINSNFNLSSDRYNFNNTLYGLLDYLTTGQVGMLPPSLNDINNPSNSSFEISIDGLSDAKVVTDESGIKYLQLPVNNTWSFDNTNYNNADGKNNDPQPQILDLHYAALPAEQDMTNAVHIHYIDVDGYDPLSEDDIESIKDQGITLAPATNKYSYQSQGDRELGFDFDNDTVIDAQSSDGVSTFDIKKINQVYDNTAKDDQILKVLVKNGYVVVQRDKQTRGKQQFDLYSSDQSNGSYDGNRLDTPLQSGFGYVEQNYYVYVKKAHQINYQVAVEDENGNVEKTLVEPTELGIGGTNEYVATSPVNGNGSTDADKQSIGAKYKDLIQQNSNLPNYNLVPSNSTDSKLKKTETLDGKKFTGDKPQLVTIYVTHKKGNVHIHYIDVDGKKPDADGNFKPSDGNEIDHTQQNLTNLNYSDPYTNILWDYAGNHYDLAATVPTDATSGTISALNKDVYVYLKHQHTNLTGTKRITEAIHYEDEEGHQVAPDYSETPTITFTNKGYHDDVANINHDDWTTENNTFAAVPLPSKLNKGYGHYIVDRVTGDEKGKLTEDKKSVAPVKVTVDQKDGKVDITVIYKAPEKAGYTIHYIDLGVNPKKTSDLQPGDGQELNHQVSVTGDIGYVTNATDKLWDYASKNYELVSEPLDLGKIKIEKGVKDQYVYLKHHTTTTTQTTTLHENIKYQYEDGTPTNLPEYNRTIKYSRTQVHDKVTNTDDPWGSWTPIENQKDKQFEAKSSDPITGYTPDKSVIKAPVPVDEDYVNGKTHDYNYVVTYKADAQKAKLRFYDDTDKKFITAAPDMTLLGKTEGKISFDPQYDFSKYNFEFVASGNDSTKIDKKLVGDKLSAVQYGKFDKDDKNDQFFIAHFTHQTTPEVQTVSVKEHIDYRYEGEKSGSLASSPYDKTVQYSRNRTKDLVNEAESTPWPDWKRVDGSQFEDKTSPNITNFKPDKESISAPTTDEINDKLKAYDPKLGKDIEFDYVVYYSHKKGKVTIHYIDVNDAAIHDPKKTSFTKDDGTELDSYKQDLGTKNYGEDYSNQLKDYAKDYYILATTEVDPAAKSGKVNSPSKDIYVFLKHSFVNVAEHAKAQEVVHYEFENGKQAHDDKKSNIINYTREGKQDLVTNNIAWDKAGWHKDNPSEDFKSIDSPTIAGYTPNKSSISAMDVETSKLNKDKPLILQATVIYTADAQKAKLRFYDDTDKKFITAAPDISVDGKTDSEISFDPQYDFSKYNFEFVASGNDPTKVDDKLAGDKLSAVQYGEFDNNDKNDQFFIVHFTHKTEPIHETVTVNETIHYVYKDGSKAHDGYEATPLIFTKTGTRDLVTGQEDVTWTKSQRFGKVVSPEIPGYTPDQAVIPAVEVDHGAHDVVRTVTYSKNVEPQEPTTPPDDNPTGPKDSPENPETPQKPEEPQKQNPEVPNKDSKHSNKRKLTKKNKKNGKKEKIRKVTKKYLTSSNRPAKAETSNVSNVPKSELLMKRIKSNNVPKSMVNNSHSTAMDNKAKTNGETLPQTGEKSSKIGIILGLLTILLANLFGLGKKNKKED